MSRFGPAGRALGAVTILLAVLCLPLPQVGVCAYAEDRAFTIQVGAFKRPDTAQVQVNRLKKAGFEAFKRRRSSKQTQWHVVYVGRFSSKGKARQEAERMKEAGIISDYLIRELRDEPGGEREEAVLIKDISFKSAGGSNEVVLIHASRLFEPRVFALEGGKPRFVIDIEKPRLGKMFAPTIPVNGKLIKEVRLHMHQDTGTLRIVLELYPSEDYAVNQLFYKAENIYALEVSRAKK